MGFLERIQAWRQLARVRPEEESPAEASGRKAELRVQELLGEFFAFRDARLLPGRRIPSKRHGRRREIDLLVCTPRMIHLIEVKNWAGALRPSDGVWRQTTRRGTTIDHPSPIQENREKREVLIEYLMDCGIVLDEEFTRKHFCEKVILMNWRLELDPAIEARREVITRHKLAEYLERRQGDGGLPAAILEYCLDSDGEPAAAPRMSDEQYARIVACLTKATTWDQLQLLGTKTLIGDLYALRLGPMIHDRTALDTMAAGAPIRFQWTRNRAVALVKAVSGIGALGRVRIGPTEYPVWPNDTVKFHLVGDDEPVYRPLVDVEAIILG